MHYYVTTPKQVKADLLDPQNESVIGSCTWPDLVKAVFMEERVQKQLDMFECYDLRQRLTNADPESKVKLTEAEKDLLAECVKKSTTLSAAVRISPGCLEMLKSLVTATTE